MAARISLAGAPELIKAFESLSSAVATSYMDESLQAGADVPVNRCVAMSYLEGSEANPKASV